MGNYSQGFFWGGGWLGINFHTHLLRLFVMMIYACRVFVDHLPPQSFLF